MESKIKVINPLKGRTDRSWFFEQSVYDSNGMTRAMKANGGTGNLPKVIERIKYEVRNENNIGQARGKENSASCQSDGGRNVPTHQAAIPADIIGEPHPRGGYAATGVIEIIRYGKDTDKHR